MRVQRQMSIAVPIPNSLPPAVVVAYLQTVQPIIRNLGTLSRFEETATVPDATGDPFFGAYPASPVASYQIFELITLAPGLSKEVTYPAYFQRVGEGVRVRANGTAGITGWCEFTVRARALHAGSSPDGAPSNISTPSTTGSGFEEYELFEALVVEANALLMPFVCQTMEVAHRGLCDKVLQEAIDQYSQAQG
jgi:hypothetical protein